MLVIGNISQCGIYKITSPTGKIYIGQSVGIKKRINSYNSLKCNRQPKLYSSFIKHGVSSHTFEIIKECDKKELDDFERYYINFFDTFNTENGLNLQRGGVLSHEISKETIEKIRISAKRNNDIYGNYCKGKKASEESRKKMSESRKAYIEKYGNYKNVITDSGRLNMAKAKLGIPQSKEHKEKRLAKIMIPIFQINPLTNECVKKWHTITEAADFLHINKSTMSAWSKSKLIHRGFIWKRNLST